MEDLKIKRGRVYYYKIFNISDSADVEGVPALAANFRELKRLKLERIASDAIDIPTPPITLYINEFPLEINGTVQKVIVKLEINELGTMAVIFEINLNGAFPLSTFREIQKNTLIEVTEDSKVSEYLQNGLEVLGPVFKGRYDQISPNVDYIAYYVEEFDRKILGKEILNQFRELPELLYNSDDPLSDQMRDRIKNKWFSYSREDLAILTYEGAFIYEPTGSTDILDILDFVNTQLVTVRYYDGLMDTRMKDINKTLRSKPSNVLSEIFHIRSRNRIMRKLMALTVEVTSALEHARNAIRITQDVYYARIYTSARQVFGLNSWETTLKNKLELVNRTSNMFYNNAFHVFDDFLEIIVIILIALELLMFFK